MRTEKGEGGEARVEVNYVLPCPHFPGVIGIMFGCRVMINRGIEIGCISIVCNDIGAICSSSFGAKKISAAIALDDKETGGQTQGRPKG